MNYATTYHIGQGTIAQRQQTKATAPTVGRILKLDATTKGRKRNSKGQATVCTDSYAANGFLKTTFLPRSEGKEAVQACTETAKMERDFYQSLSRLAAHYGTELMYTQSFPYPYNLSLALWDAERQLKNKVKDWDAIKIIQDCKNTYVATEERYNTGATLYYIPMLPLYKMLKNPQQKSAALLLLSVCSYLYHYANIPYYTQEENFLYWQYEMLKEWVMDDDVTDETTANLRKLKQATCIGNIMERKIFHQANLNLFDQRINTFKCKDALDSDILKVAKEAYAVYSLYPDATIFRNASYISDTGCDDEEEEMENTVTMDKYISFSADAKGWLHENLIQNVNTELQEYMQMQEPTVTKIFDGRNTEYKDLGFENRLFALLHELICLLNNL